MRSALLAMALLTCMQALVADAQPPPATPPKGDAESRYDIDKGKGVVKPPARIDPAQTLFVQADELIFDEKGNRVIVRGNVEIYYNNYLLTADMVIYDKGLNKLTAEGNTQLKDPNGQIIRADRFEATDDFRDAFALKIAPLLEPPDPRFSTGPRGGTGKSQ